MAQLVQGWGMEPDERLQDSQGAPAMVNGCSYPDPGPPLLCSVAGLSGYGQPWPSPAQYLSAWRDRRALGEAGGGTARSGGPRLSYSRWERLQALNGRKVHGQVRHEMGCQWSFVCL